MKKYIVTEKLLQMVREFMNNNPHASGCNMNDFWSNEDHCDCLNTNLRRRYIEECKKIVEVKEETSQLVEVKE